MPPVPVPPEIDAFLAAPNRAVVATVRPDGTPHTAATWYDWEDGRVLMNMHEVRLRLGYLRANPGVALTVLGDDWEQHVTLLGRVVSIEEDEELRDADRLALRYTPDRHQDRVSRRFSVWMVPARWYQWPPPD